MSGWSNQPIVTTLVIIEGTQGGLFIYSGTPALGNLIISAAAAAGTDPFGNVYPQGIEIFGTGQLIAGNVIVNPSGVFVYSGTPAAGNLIVSVAPSAGTDAFGNAYLQGIELFGQGADLLSFSTKDAQETLPGFISAAIQGVGGPRQANLVLQPSELAGGGGAQLAVFSDSRDGTVNGSVQVTGPMRFVGQTAPSVALAGFPGLYADSASGQMGVVSSAALAQQVSGSFLSSVNGTSPITSTTLTAIGFRTIPSGDPVAGASYQIHASGTFTLSSTPTNPPTFSVFWGGIAGTQIASLQIPAGDMPAGAVTAAGWFADAEVNWTSATATEVTLTVGWHSGNGVGASLQRFTVIDTTGLSTSGNHNLSLAFQWGTLGSPSLTTNVCRIGRVT